MSPIYWSEKLRQTILKRKEENRQLTGCAAELVEAIAETNERLPDESHFDFPPPWEQKPPLGVKPKTLHEQERAENLILAAARYILDGRKQVPREWLLELRSLIVPE